MKGENQLESKNTSERHALTEPPEAGEPQIQVWMEEFGPKVRYVVRVNTVDVKGFPDDEDAQQLAENIRRALASSRPSATHNAEFCPSCGHPLRKLDGSDVWGGPEETKKGRP